MGRFISSQMPPHHHTIDDHHKSHHILLLWILVRLITSQLSTWATQIMEKLVPNIPYGEMNELQKMGAPNSFGKKGTDWVYTREGVFEEGDILVVMNKQYEVTTA